MYIYRQVTNKFFWSYMRRLRGKLREINSATKLRTELRELRSRAKTKISESGNSDTIRALASTAALRFRAGRTSLAPRLANTRAVSAPIPDVAPGEPHDQSRSN
ncbi:unnamed protein product [Ilex paraguariensis]|uniref:Uncharacterized protein n=1 Tax=Ilex paraguariensis TaxID=185542 RepID=A0ABC8RU20_9AQUA